MKNKYTPTIGLEIHVELKTKSKMFCGCSSEHFRVKPNTHTCPVCLGLPGALPVPNKKAIEWTIKTGLALNSNINIESKFDRKHYFYPDLPKGYQISQYDKPFCNGGFIKTSEKNIRLTRVHLEEDTGKLVHKNINGKDVSLVDFNRSGVPLMEIVTMPDLRSGYQAKEFAQKLRKIVKTLGVSDCDMEKGSMRLEANISLGLEFGYKVEVKNLNSFRFIEKAIEYELKRQKILLDKGVTPEQETRGWSETKNITVSQRYKESEADYRYFPEPDIPPFKLDNNFIFSIKDKLPELPDDLVNRLIKKYSIRKDYAIILSSSNEILEYSEKAFDIAKKQEIKAEKVAGVIINQKIDIKKVLPSELIENIILKKSSLLTDEKELNNIIKKAIKELPKAVDDYKSGKTSAVSVIIGKVMQLSKGQADPILTRKLITKILG